MDSIASSIAVGELAIALDDLARAIIEHNRQLLAGEPVDWNALIRRLGIAERDCRWLRSPTPNSRVAVTRRPTERLDRTPIYG